MVSVSVRRAVGVLLTVAVGSAALLLWRGRSLSPDAVATVQAELPGLIEADMNLLDLPADPAAQEQALHADRRGALRAAVLSVWDRGAADKRLDDVEASRQQMLRDHVEVYNQVRVSVASWDHIGGSGNNAEVRVTLRAAVRRAATGVWDDPTRAQWEFGLRKQRDGTWKLSGERVTAYLSGQN